MHSILSVILILFSLFTFANNPISGSCLTYPEEGLDADSYHSQVEAFLQKIGIEYTKTGGREFIPVKGKYDEPLQRLIRNFKPIWTLTTPSYPPHQQSHPLIRAAYEINQLIPGAQIKIGLYKDGNGMFAPQFEYVLIDPNILKTGIDHQYTIEHEMDHVRHHADTLKKIEVVQQLQHGHPVSNLAQIKQLQAFVPEGRTMQFRLEPGSGQKYPLLQKTNYDTGFVGEEAYNNHREVLSLLDEANHLLQTPLTPQTVKTSTQAISNLEAQILFATQFYTTVLSELDTLLASSHLNIDTSSTLNPSLMADLQGQTHSQSRLVKYHNEHLNRTLILPSGRKIIFSSYSINFYGITTSSTSASIGSEDLSLNSNFVHSIFTKIRQVYNQQYQRINSIQRLDLPRLKQILEEKTAEFSRSSGLIYDPYFKEFYQTKRLADVLREKKTLRYHYRKSDGFETFNEPGKFGFLLDTTITKGEAGELQMTILRRNGQIEGVKSLGRAKRIEVIEDGKVTEVVFQP